MSKLKNKKNIQKEENKTDNLISVIILCDLPGYRMKSYGPTSLVKIKNKYLLDIQIETIKKTFQNYEIIICIGFDGNKILKYIRSKYTNLNIRIVENQIFNNCNSCEGLRIALNNTLNNKILIIEGSLLINKKALSSINMECNCALIEKINSDNMDIGINIDANHKAQYFSFGAYRTWSEIFFLNDNATINSIMKFLDQEESKKKFIFEALNYLIKNKYNIICTENNHQIYKINNIKAYHNIKENHEVFNI